MTTSQNLSAGDMLQSIEEDRNIQMHFSRERDEEEAQREPERQKTFDLNEMRPSDNSRAEFDDRSSESIESEEEESKERDAQ